MPQIPEEILFGNEAIQALAGVSAVAPGMMYWTIKGSGASGPPSQIWPTDLPGGGTVRAYSLDAAMMLGAPVDESQTNLHKSFEQPQNYKAFLINGWSVDHIAGQPTAEGVLIQTFLQEAALWGSATFRINEKAIVRAPMSHMQTASGITVCAWDRPAEAQITASHLNEGRPGAIVKWPDDEVLLLPKSKSFDVMLHYLVSRMTALSGLPWAIRVALWGKAVLQVD
jgi:hypothetical protein